MLVLIGGAAGLALWALGEAWRTGALPPAVWLALVAFVAAGATVALALGGPLDAVRALAGGAGLSAVLCVLLLGASARYSVATDILDAPEILGIWMVLVFLATPFLSVRLQDRANWLDYCALFQTAWTMTVRYGVAWIFVALFWLLVFLSDALLGLVGVTWADLLLQTDWVRFALSGAVLGLALAVAYELRDTISPYLFLRLLRLLLPVVLGVVALFLAAIPARGLSRLFGDFSAAATLMTTAMVAITLVSAALDRDSRHEVSSRGLRLATRGLAVLLPFLTGLAVWAILIRVGQYGWTPERLLAAVIAACLSVYAIGYALSAAWGRDWTGHIRRLNVHFGLGLLAVSVLWLSPVLNAYRIATASQIARYERGATAADDLPIWEMAHEWGRAGTRGLVRLESATAGSDRERLTDLIARARQQASRYGFQQEADLVRTTDTAAALARKIPMRPPEGGLDPAILALLPGWRISQWDSACERTLADGEPGCVLISGRFRPGIPPDRQAIALLLGADDTVQAQFLSVADDGTVWVRDIIRPDDQGPLILNPEQLQQALRGEFGIEPSGASALTLGGSRVIP